MKQQAMLKRMGILGIIGFLSYTAAVVFAPLAYPGYDWLRQAVSDLSAANAPSRALWGQLASLYNVCELITLMMVCVYVQGRLTRTLRLGLYTFTAMTWVSAVGYAMFPLTDSGYAGAFQDVMHMVVTALVVLLSIVGLVLILVGGYRRGVSISLAVWATLSLVMMFAGAMGINLAGSAYFGLMERFSVFSAVGFTAVLGVYLMRGFPTKLPAES